MADSTPLNTAWELNLSPEILDSAIVEVVDSDNSPGSYQRIAPGTPHPNQELYPGYLFLTQKTASHDKVQQYWTTPGYTAQDLYNYELDYVSDSPDHPIYLRRYKTRRDQYQKLAAAATLTGIWKVKIDNPGSGYDPDQPPAVSFGGPGSGATGEALVNPNGTIAWIRIRSEGSGYTSAPTVTIAAPSAGVTATATATVQGSACYLIKQTTQQFPEDDPRFSLFLIEVRVYQSLPGPTLTTWEFQERINAYVRIDKRLILKSTVPANPNATVLAKNITKEFQDITAIYSAEITTTIPADIAWENDGADFVYEGSIDYRFPDEVREDPVIIVAATLTDQPSFAVDYGWQCTVTEGYSGPCRAVITERHTFDPTNAAFIAALPTPTSIFPRADTFWVATNASVGGQARADVVNFTVPLSLHRTLTATSTATQYMPPQFQFREPIPATVPSGFEEGDSILKVTEPQRVGIGKLWLVRIIEIFHPARA